MPSCTELSYPWTPCTVPTFAIPYYNSLPVDSMYCAYLCCTILFFVTCGFHVLCPPLLYLTVLLLVDSVYCAHLCFILLCCLWIPCTVPTSALSYCAIYLWIPCAVPTFALFYCVTYGFHVLCPPLLYFTVLPVDSMYCAHHLLMAGSLDLMT
jgi:hypothetical protein